MSVRLIVQKLLDDTLLSRGILSHYQRKIEVETPRDARGRFVTLNPNVYLVYRILTPGINHGDGKPLTAKPYIDINLYFAFDKTMSRYEDADVIINDIKRAFLNHGHFVLSNDATDLYETDTTAPYHGINIEFRYIGAYSTLNTEGL